MRGVQETLKIYSKKLMKIDFLLDFSKNSSVSFFAENIFKGMSPKNVFIKMDKSSRKVQNMES